MVLLGKMYNYTKLDRLADPDRDVLAEKQDVDISDRAARRSAIFKRVLSTTALLVVGCGLTWVLATSSGPVHKAEVLPSSGMLESSDASISVQPCGNSSKEAIERGCTFDQLMWSWFPPECPHYANDEYLGVSEWLWYTEPYEKILMKEEEWPLVLDNQLVIYGQEREHRMHCVYMFLTLAQIVNEKGRSVPKHTNYKHLEHCAHFLRDMVMEDEASLRVGTRAPAVTFNQQC